MEGRYMVRTWLPERAETPATIGEKFLRTLDTLSLIDPIFNPWYVDPRMVTWDEIIQLADRVEAGKFKDIHLEEVRGNMTSFIEERLSRDDYNEPDPYFGYHAAAYNRSDNDKEAALSLNVRISLTVGGQWKNYVEIKMDENSAYQAGYSVVTYPIFKDALVATMSIWAAPCGVASIYNDTYSRATQVAGVPLLPKTTYHIPWIGYLSPERARNVDPPRDMLTETTPDGGLLMSATHEPFDPANVEHMTRAKAILEVLSAHGGDE